MSLEMTFTGDGNMMYYNTETGQTMFPWEAQQYVDQQTIAGNKNTTAAQNQIAPPIYNGGGEGGGGGAPIDGNQAWQPPIDNQQAVADRAAAQQIVNDARTIAGYSYGMPVYADQVPNGGAGMSFDPGSAEKAAAMNAANHPVTAPVAPTTQIASVGANPAVKLNTNLGTNPGLMPVNPYFQTTNDVQSQYSWAPRSEANPLQAGQQTWGIQQPTRAFDVNQFIGEMLGGRSQAQTATLPTPYPGK